MEQDELWHPLVLVLSGFVSSCSDTTRLCLRLNMLLHSRWICNNCVVFHVRLYGWCRNWKQTTDTSLYTIKTRHIDRWLIDTIWPLKLGYNCSFVIHCLLKQITNRNITHYFNSGKRVTWSSQTIWPWPTNPPKRPSGNRRRSDFESSRELQWKGRRGRANTGLWLILYNSLSPFGEW